MTTVSNKVVWKIKKEDFEKGNFGDCKLQLGEFEWYIGNSCTNSQSDQVANFKISWDRSPSELTSFINLHHSGCFTLLGFNEKHNAVHKWSDNLIYVEDFAGNNTTFNINLPIDNSTLSFDEKYLFPDGTYRVHLRVTIKDLSVDFGSPNHELLLSDADTGCLQIDEHKLYVSKSVNLNDF